MTRAAIPEAELRRFARLAAPLLQGTAAMGLGPRAARNRAGAGLEFLDIRRYEAGDDSRSIDWRQSARSRQLMIRRYRNETAADWFICVDGSASVGWGKRKWPATMRLATALAYTLLYAGHRVALLLFSDRIRGACDLGRGAHHQASLLAVLDGHSPAAMGRSAQDKSSNLGLCRPMLTQNSNVFVLSDFLEPGGMRDELKSIRARVASVNAIQVLDEAEVHIPAHGVVALHDIESGEVRHVVMTEHAVKTAQNALSRHCMNLDKACAGLGIRFTTARTEQRWQQVLLDHLQR